MTDKPDEWMEEAKKLVEIWDKDLSGEGYFSKLIATALKEQYERGCDEGRIDYERGYERGKGEADALIHAEGLEAGMEHIDEKDKEIEALKEEVEKLENRIVSQKKELWKGIDGFKAQRDRYREALEKIQEFSMQPSDLSACQIASDALED